MELNKIQKYIYSNSLDWNFIPMMKTIGTLFQNLEKTKLNFRYLFILTGFLIDEDFACDKLHIASCYIVHSICIQICNGFLVKNFTGFWLLYHDLDCIVDETRKKCPWCRLLLTDGATLPRQQNWILRFFPFFFFCILSRYRRRIKVIVLFIIFSSD